ncbi:DUF3857 domain-containing protein [Flavobacteriaceae bacterium A100]|uniref:DUF3857 domain-containing protein n=1 Tax=Oceanihabitans sediminis TaxID=1812012 RepID=UPI000930B6D9
MKKIYLLISFLLTTVFLGQAQQFHHNYYAATKADLETNIFEKDSTANALVIYEFGKTYVDDSSFELKHEFKQKLKILNKKGYNHATVMIYLYNSGSKKEKVSDIQATTHNLVNGNIHKTELNKNEIYTEKFNENYTLVKFTFPNIQEGSVITYSYTLTLPFIYKFKGWEFQSEIPKLYSEYNTSIPANYDYNIKLVGTIPLAKNKSDLKHHCLETARGGSSDCTESIYIMKDIPAFIEEDFMTTKSNYLSRIEYELKTFKGFDGTVENITKTWKNTDREIRDNKNIGKQLKRKVDKKQLLSADILEEKDALKKAEQIYKHIQDNYTWNSNYSIFEDVSIKNLIDKKSGSVSEINILLHNLLEACNIEVKPIILSTRNNGLPTTIYPVISDFNYLIVQASINNKTYLLDATDRYLSFGQIPFRALNQYGRLLDFKNGSKWVDIEALPGSNINYRVNLQLHADQNITGEIQFNNRGYPALTEKKSYFENPIQHQKDLQDEYENLEIFEYQAETEAKNSLDFNESFKINYEAEQIGEQIYINPFIFTFFEENPFKLQERSYPLDFGYKRAYIYSYKIKIDSAFEILETPKETILQLPENTGQLLFNTLVNNNEIIVYFKLSFNQEIYTKEFYPYIKKAMSTVVNIQKNSTIVLKRSN